MKTKSFANAVLIAGGLMALLALWRHLYASGWIGPQPFASEARGPESIVFAALATLFLASLRLRLALRVGIAVVSVSLLAVLYAAELVLANTSLGPGANLPFWSIDRASSQRKRDLSVLAAQSGGTIDTRDRVEVLDDARRRGIDMVPAIMLADVLGGDGTATVPESTDHEEPLVPLGGISSSPTLLCNESGQFVSYSSDEHGFRNPRGIWNSERVDIAAVGQSLTQGYCVPDGQEFVDLLRAHNLVVLNLGTSGQSGLLQLGAIKEYLPRYAPKHVLWFFIEGIDLADLYIESTHPFLMGYLEPTFSQHLLTRQPEIDRLLRRTVSTIEARERVPHSAASRSYTERALEIARLWSLRQKVALIYGDREGPEVWSMLERPHNLLSTVLEQARTVTSSWGGTLYFVYLPSWTRFRNSPRAADEEHAKVLSVVRALGIPVIDVQPAFQAQHDPLSLFPFRRFGHYNEQGNTIVAESVLKSLSVP
jgi:hypothetical protein